MDLVLTCAVLSALVLAAVLAHGQHGTPLHDKSLTQDRNHIMEHYEGVLEPGAQDTLSDDELNFHYFKVHDYDNNNMLDGLELVSALTHYHGEGAPDAAVLPDRELEVMVDAILNDDDANRDGYIDYPEYIVSQRR